MGRSHVEVLGLARLGARSPAPKPSRCGAAAGDISGLGSYLLYALGAGATLDDAHTIEVLLGDHLVTVEHVMSKR
jgi:hypothetical protein